MTNNKQYKTGFCAGKCGLADTLLFKSLEMVRFFFLCFLKINIFCSPQLHLFGQNYSKTVIL